MKLQKTMQIQEKAKKIKIEITNKQNDDEFLESEFNWLNLVRLIDLDFPI